MNRVLNVARMQLVNRQTFIWIPLIILAGSTLIAIGFMVVIPQMTRGEDGPMFAGSSQAPLWYFLALGISTLSYTFPFSQAMSISRRTFYLGTLLIVSAASAVMATLFCLMALIEQVTGGYGVNGYIFHLPWVMDNGMWQGWLMIFFGTILFFTIGFFFTAVFKRYGGAVLAALLVGFGIVLLGALWYINTNEAWPQVGQWFMQQTPLTVSAYAALAVIPMSAISYAALRKMTV